jgi:hypothetical protein
MTRKIGPYILTTDSIFFNSHAVIVKIHGCSMHRLGELTIYLLYIFCLYTYVWRNNTVISLIASWWSLTIDDEKEIRSF